ncbi:hypothetical protein [Synechococcus sp. Lug-A]|nr:hypothetical protein [Synechococcus sp. Lug-A]
MTTRATTPSARRKGVIAAITLASIWKSTTGRGWTWRGRSLA